MFSMQSDKGVTAILLSNLVNVSFLQSRSIELVHRLELYKGLEENILYSDHKYKVRRCLTDGIRDTLRKVYFESIKQILICLC